MMPGESQSRTVAIAADATMGNCQNCSVLQQNLTEYVSSFVALKQKITVTDDTIRLQQQLEELQIRLGTLETKTADYECVQAELEEKKNALKAYVDLSEEMGSLKDMNAKIMAENKELADQLKSEKEMAEAQSLENSQLRRKKAVLENDLLQTHENLKRLKTQAEKGEMLMMEKSKMASIKEDLENKVRFLKDSICKQNQQILKVTKEKTLLERNIDDLQVRMMRLERENCKEYRSTATQASAPREPKVDKERFKTLLENLWACVEPEQKQPTNQLHFIDSSDKVFSSPQSKLDFCGHEKSLPASSEINESFSSHTAPKSSLQALNAFEDQASGLCLREKKLAQCASKGRRSNQEDKTNETVSDMSNLEMSVEKILEYFKCLPPCISPLQELLESKDIDNKQNENDPTLTEEREEVFHTATLLSNQKKSQTTLSPPGEDMVSPMAKQKDDTHISNETDLLAQRVLSSPMKDEINDVNRNAYPQKITVTESEPASVQSVSTTELSCSSMDVTDLVESISVPTDGLSHPSGDASSSSEAETGNSTGEAKQDPSENLIKMDVDASPSSGTDAKTITPGDGESPTGRDAPVIASEALIMSQASPSTFASNVKDADAPKTESTSADKESRDTSTIKPPQNTASPRKDQEMTKMSLSAANGLCVSQEIVEHRTDMDVSITVLEKDYSDAIHESGEDDVKSSPIKSNSDNKLLSPMNSTAPMEDQDHGETVVETPSQNDTIVDTIEIKTKDDHVSLSDFGKTQTLECKSLKDDTHSPCRELSPRCVSSIVKLQTVESHPNPSKVNVEINSECISKNKIMPVLSLEREGTIERTIVGDSPRDSIDVDTAASFIQNAAPTHKPNNCLESRTEECEDPASDSDRGKKERTATISTTEFMSQILSEVGAPLPPLLTPLDTPPKMGSSINPRHAIGKLLFPSPMDTLHSPITPNQAHLTPNSQQQSSSSLNSPICSNGVPSSPLQFGSATPKHAVPVPGRLPITAMNSSQPPSTSPSQENSMRILDSMYPELSARARTLSILRGNVSLTVGSSESGSLPMAADSQASSFKTLNSTATAFTKTDVRGEKRSATCLLQPVNKCLRLDSSSADVVEKHVLSSSTNGDEDSSSRTLNVTRAKNATNSGLLEMGDCAKPNFIVDSLKKIESHCFDLLPVIRSHLHVGSLPKKPVLRDEEKEVISEFCKSSSHMADEMILAILNKLKAGKQELSSNSMQALCRVYTGICRQKGDHEKAHLLAYNILAEDFPECAQLVLFMVTTWPTVLSHSSPLCQAIHTVTKLKATNEILSCLSPFLGWEKSPPCDIDHLISRTLSEIKTGANLSFTKHSRYGEDLSTVAWERVFTLHLLCSHKSWKWSYEHLLGKELWPIMNAWVTQPRDKQEPISDVTVATVLRLIGYLCQLGLKEKSVTSVVTVANVINTFGRHAQTEGVPWEVQLAAVYSIYNLSPCNPKHALDALGGWRGEATQKVPPAVTSYINQLASICRQVKR